MGRMGAAAQIGLDESGVEPGWHLFEPIATTLDRFKNETLLG
jgi:hypothetical protein